MSKIINYILAGLLLALSFIFLLQRCSLKKLQQENKILKVKVGNLTFERDFLKWFNETTEFLNEIKEKKINKINQSDKNELTDIANKYFKFGVRMHKDSLQNNPPKNNNPPKTKVRKN